MAIYCVNNWKLFKIMRKHIDFIFYAKSKSSVLKPQIGESRELYWYSKEDIENSNSINDVVKTYALEALEKLKE